jgi:hypothetical protein
MATGQFDRFKCPNGQLKFQKLQKIELHISFGSLLYSGVVHIELVIYNFIWIENAMKLGFSFSPLV